MGELVDCKQVEERAQVDPVCASRVGPLEPFAAIGDRGGSERGEAGPEGVRLAGKHKVPGSEVRHPVQRVGGTRSPVVGAEDQEGEPGVDPELIDEEVAGSFDPLDDLTEAGADTGCDEGGYPATNGRESLVKGLVESVR